MRGEKPRDHRRSSRRVTPTPRDLDGMHQQMRGRRIELARLSKRGLRFRFGCSIERHEVNVCLPQLRPRCGQFSIDLDRATERSDRRICVTIQIRHVPFCELRVLRWQRRRDSTLYKQTRFTRTMICGRGLRATHRRKCKAAIGFHCGAEMFERFTRARASKGSFTGEKTGDRTGITI